MLDLHDSIGNYYPISPKNRQGQYRYSILAGQVDSLKSHPPHSTSISLHSFCSVSSTSLIEHRFPSSILSIPRKRCLIHSATSIFGGKSKGFRMRSTSTIMLSVFCQGYRLYSILQKTTPRLQTSHLMVQGSPMMICGDMQMGVPTEVCAAGLYLVSQSLTILANPKSDSFSTPVIALALPSAVMSMFSVLISRWYMFLPSRQQHPLASCRKSGTALACSMCPWVVRCVYRLLRGVSRYPPEQNSRKKQMLLAVSEKSMNSTMFWWWIDFQVLTSFLRALMKYSLVSDLFLERLILSIRFFFSIILQASTLPVLDSIARQVFAKLPSPNLRSFIAQ